MDKIYLSNHIKLEILSICGQSTSKSYNLEGNTPLFTLGYDDTPHCKMLEKKLQMLATYYKTGKSIPSGVISKNLTVSQCIQLVLI
ncbi:MAG TPA: hypothetical protein VL490_10125 [Mucilaginibacter sp.]|jgi:hypothetical protein|nr:hypothetical protein [Mucilaginibacter sp.]